MPITRIQKKVCKDFEIRNLEEHHDLCVQSNTLLLADVFENLRNIFLEIYELDPAHFHSIPGLAGQTALKKTKAKLDFLTDIDMLLMVQKGITGGIFHSIYQYAKANNKYISDYDKNKELSYLQYWDVNSLYGRLISQKLSVKNFKWVKDISKFDKKFIES